MRHNLIGAALTAFFLAMPCQVKAQEVLFDFNSTGVVGAANFDPSEVGETITVNQLGFTIVEMTKRMLSLFFFKLLGEKATLCCVSWLIREYTLENGSGVSYHFFRAPPRIVRIILKGSSSVLDGR